MNNCMDHKIFLSIGFKKIIIFALNSKKQTLYKKETTTLNSSVFENLHILNHFLKENIFVLEKKLNKFINKINLILDHHDFFSIYLSVKNRSEIKILGIDQINNLLFDSRNQVKKTLGENQIIHMKILKFIIDGKDYFLFPEKTTSTDFSIEVEFICLPKILIKNFKNIFINYQILIDKVLCYNYINTFQSEFNDDFFTIADDILNGLNQNEVFLINKSVKNKGIFEKFFNFFN